MCRRAGLKSLMWRPIGRECSPDASCAGSLRGLTSGNRRFRAWRATLISTSCGWGLTGGKWRLPSSTSWPSGGCASSNVRTRGSRFMYRKSWSIRTAIILLTCGTWVSGQAAAQSPATGTAADETGPSPISCWWKADKNGVRVGEAFGLTLTCRVLETERAVVVPNVTNIEPNSLQLTPYDVIEGTRHEDIVMPPWRYI